MTYTYLNAAFFEGEGLIHLTRPKRPESDSVNTSVSLDSIKGGVFLDRVREQ